MEFKKPKIVQHRLKFQVCFCRAGKKTTKLFDTREEAEKFVEELPPPNKPKYPEKKPKPPTKPDGPRRPGNGGGELKTGNAGNKGGSGTLTNDIREIIRKGVRSEKLTERYIRLAAGKLKGAPIKEQRLAMEKLHEWGWTDLKREQGDNWNFNPNDFTPDELRRIVAGESPLEVVASRSKGAGGTGAD